MKDDLVFRTGLVKRTLGWLVCLGAAGALVAMAYGVLTHPEAQVPAELWSGAAIGVFLVGLMIYGISLQSVRWSIEGEKITFHRLFKNKTIPVSGLKGYGEFILIVFLFPFAHVDLYDSELKLVARLPISLKDRPRAEAWLAERFRPVVNDGSPALPRLRFADTPKA